MKLKDLLSQSSISSDLESQDKEGVLRELSELAGSRCDKLVPDDVFQILSDREKLGSTGVGNGVAIPHGKIKGLEDVLILFGRSKKGIDFKSHDHKPAYLFFVVLAPETVVGVHLQVLARLSRLLKAETTRDKIINISDDSLFETIIAEDEKL